MKPMTEIETTALDRVEKVRAELIQKHRFYGVLVSQVEPVLSRQFPTAATNGKKHFFNPDYVATLTRRQLEGLQRHESEHDARHHGTRRGNRDPFKWNVATDFGINIDLIDEGVELPEGALIDAKYRGWSAEEIYRARELDEGKEKREQQNDEPTPPGSSSGDPGRAGEVLDSVGDDNTTDVSEEDSRWETIVRQAAGLAKAAGQLPGHVSRDIERANKPPRDWRDELREFAEQGALRVETWNRPNRRFVGQGLTLPSTQKDGVNKAAFLIDTSGSMDDVALALVNAEAQALLDDGVINEAVVVYGDTRVTRVDTYQTGDVMTFDPRGGGGTQLKPLFDYVAEHHDDASLIITFTDLFVFDLHQTPAPQQPVLFAVTGYPDQVKQLIATAPWGSRGIDVGAH